MKKRTIILIRVILILLIIGLLVFGMTKLSLNIIGKSTVENYCSTAYHNNVDEYKKCGEMNTIELIDSLKEKESKRHEIPNLPTLKF